MGTFAFNEIIRHAFDDLNLNRMEAFILTDNAASLALCRKVGFQQEGVLRQYAFKDGEYRDTVIMSILREEWKKNGN